MMAYDTAIKKNICHISIWHYYQDIFFNTKTMTHNKMCAWPLAWDESKGNTLGTHSATAIQGFNLRPSPAFEFCAMCLYYLFKTNIQISKS